MRIHSFAALTLAFAIKALSSNAQTNNQKVILNAGNSNYVTINNANYPRGEFITQYNYYAADSTDSTIAVLWANTRNYFIKPSKDTFFVYGDSSNKVSRNIQELRTWFINNNGN